MNNPFSQPKLIYEISFITSYKDIEIFEKFFPEDVLGICTYEVKSLTIDSQDDDLWVIEILTGEKHEFQSLVNELKIYAKANSLHFHSEVTLQQVEDKDWVAEYQKQLKPIEIGRFFITSSSISANCPKDKIPIYIEASRAFGTGDHATTSLCIDSMNSLKDHAITTMFDIGTGSGILSFVAEKIWPMAKILACDIEEVSIKIAKENRICNNSNIYFYQNSEHDLNIPKEWSNPKSQIKMNNCDLSGERQQAVVYREDVSSMKNRICTFNWGTWDKKFDLIVSNILAAPLISMSKAIKSISHKNTLLILSGFLDYQLSSVVKAYNSSGFEIVNSLQKDRWVTLIFKVNVD